MVWSAKGEIKLLLGRTVLNQRNRGQRGTQEVFLKGAGDWSRVTGA